MKNAAATTTAGGSANTSVCRGYHKNSSAKTAAAKASAGSSFVTAKAENSPADTKWYHGGPEPSLALGLGEPIRSSDIHANITANVPTVWLLNVTRNGVTSVANAPAAKT